MQIYFIFFSYRNFMLLLQQRKAMIELKNISAIKKPDVQLLRDYSLIVRDGEFCQLERMLGETVIDIILGFQPVAEGFVTFDGMPLTAGSAFFFRKMIAYIPRPEGFEKVSDLSRKQLEMVAEAVKSDADIILAVDPVSHQSDEVARSVFAELRGRAAKGSVVIVASDRNDL